MQKKLLVEADLTLAKAADIARGSEAADQNSKVLNPRPDVRPTHSVGQLAAAKPNPPSSQKSGKKVPCPRCGRTNHTSGNCKFVDATCHKCGKKGHISPACRSGGKPRKSPQAGRAAWVAEAETESTDTGLPIYTVQRDAAHRPITVPVKINDQRVEMEVDTGAAVSLIPEAVQRELFPDAQLHPSRVLLKTYTGEPLRLKGEMSVRVEYQGQQHHLPLTVVEGDGPTLFGRDWLESIRSILGRFKRVGRQLT